MAVTLATVLAALAAVGVTALVYKLFFAPIVPRGFESFLTIPHDPASVTRFGKWFGDLPVRDFMRNHRHFRSLVQRYGPIVRKRVIGRNVVIVGSVELGGEVLRDKEHFLERGYTGIVEVAPKGLLSLDTNDEWAVHRRAISPMFADRYMKIYSESMYRITHVLLDRLDKLPPTKSFEVHSALSAVALDVLGMAGFGREFDAVAGKGEAFVRAGDAVLHGAVWMTVVGKYIYRWWDAFKAYDAGRKLFALAIEDSLGAMGDDNSHMLAQLHKAGLSRSDLNDELLTIVMAGHETSANAMTWCIYLLSQNPDALKKLQEEVDDLYEKPSFSEENIYENRADLPFLRACLLEALRLYPTVPVMPRMCTKATKLGGYDIFPGVIVFNSTYSAFRNPDSFPEPDKFDPTRFLNSDKIIDGESYYPFGAGARICVGRRFAMLEMTMVLAMLYRRFTFELDPSVPVVERGHITLTSEHGVHMFVRKRG